MRVFIRVYLVAYATLFLALVLFGLDDYFVVMAKVALLFAVFFLGMLWTDK